MVCWPCLGLSTVYIWSSYLIIKGVKWYLKGLTFDLEYLTLSAKIRHSASLRFCVWSFCTYLCNLSLIGWEMREEFAKMWKIDKKRYHPLWPWPWSDDLGTHMVCWPCLGLPTMYIWSSYLIIKGVKRYVKGLTFDLEYLTLRAKIQNSAAFRFCVWSFCTYLCVFSLVGWEMREEFAKMRKNCQNWPVYRPGWPWPWGTDLETYARKLLFWRCIYWPSFAKIGKW